MNDTHLHLNTIKPNSIIKQENKKIKKSLYIKYTVC